MEFRERSVKEYYGTIESRLLYRYLLKGSQHFGYYPNGDTTIGESRAQRMHHDLLAALLDRPMGSMILDAGCGQGAASADIALRYGLRVVGIDIVPYILKKARRRRNSNWKLTQLLDYEEMSYNDIKFPDSSFDGVYTIEALSHSQDLYRSVKELCRVLRAGGKMVLFEYKVAAIPSFSNLENKMRLLVKNGAAMHSLEQFRGDNLRNLIAETGLTDITETNISANALPSLHRLYRMLRYPYMLVNKFGRNQHFINTTAAVEYYKMARKGLLEYFVYTAVKS